MIPMTHPEAVVDAILRIPETRVSGIKRDY